MRDTSVLSGCLSWGVVRGLQKIDKELATAIAALEKEKAAALSDLDSQVRDCPILQSCGLPPKP